MHFLANCQLTETKKERAVTKKTEILSIAEQYEA